MKKRKHSIVARDAAELAKVLGLKKDDAVAMEFRARLNKKIEEMNAIIAKLDDGKAVFFKDIGQEFLDQNGGLSGEIMPDYLHLSAKGYDIWGKAIKADIEKLVQ